MAYISYKIASSRRSVSLGAEGRKQRLAALFSLFRTLFSVLRLEEASYKNLRYNFDKSAEKINERVLVPSSHVKACHFLGFVECFFLKLSTTIFPLYGANNLVD